MGLLAFILIRRDEPRNKRVWAITPEQADYLYKRKDGKSINWKWFHANALRIKEIKNTNKMGITFEDLINITNAKVWTTQRKYSSVIPNVENLSIRLNLGEYDVSPML